MNATDPANDPFCEIQFWQGMGINTIITNPIAAATGLAMSCIACVPILDSNVHPPRVPFMFYVGKAAVFVTGLGTAVFHSVSLQITAINVRNLDWTPIVIMGVAAILLFLSHDLFVPNTHTGELDAMAACTCALLWMVTNIMIMDSGTRPVLADHSGGDSALMWANGFLLLPFLIILVRMLLEPTMRTHMLPGGLLCALSAVLWAINSALCREHPWLSTLHALYHLTITVAYLHLISIAAEFVSVGYLRLEPLYVWPRLRVGQQDPAQAVFARYTRL